MARHKLNFVTNQDGDEAVKRGGEILLISLESFANHVRTIPGLNPRRVIGADQEDQDLLNAVLSGAEMPPIDCIKMKDDDGEYLGVVSGNRRHWAYTQAWKHDVNVPRIAVALSNPKLSWADLLSRACASNQHKPLTASEKGAAYAEMKNMGLTIVEIAKKQSESTAKVAYLIKLHEGATPEILEAVDAGTLTQKGALEIVKRSETVEDQEIALEVVRKEREEGVRSPTGRKAREKKVATPLDKIEKLLGYLDPNQLNQLIRICGEKLDKLEGKS